MVDTTKLVKEYQEANTVLDQRITDKKFGFDTFDKLYNTYIDPAKWPYSVKLATPRGFTSIFNKTTRVIGGRFTGKIAGVEMGDELGAKIATEHFKWSVDRFNQFSDQPIEQKIAVLDTNARLYGAGFLRTYWRQVIKMVKNHKTGKKEAKVIYDGWWVDVLNNRDVLTQPGRESIDNSEYFIVRRYVSLEELERNQEDGAGYIKEALAELKNAKTGTGKDANYTPTVKTIKGLSWEDDRFEVCVHYYKNNFVTWCPKQGTKGKKDALVLREKENTYRHQTIPTVSLVYIPSQEDIYGMSELQPVSTLLKVLSALQSQVVELINKDLYPPTLVSATETRMDTFKYRPKAFWLVNDPSRVAVLDTKASQSIGAWGEIYKMLVTEFLEAMGETGTGVSQTDLLGGDKTATEVKDRAFLRTSRDNFNKMMLNAALKKLMYQLFEMLRDTQFTSKDTVIKVVGKDALEYFDKQGLSSWGINDQGYELVLDVANQLENNPAMVEAAKEQGQSLFDIAYQILANDGTLDGFAEPLSPVMTAKEGLVEKLKVDEDGLNGYLHVNPDDDYLGEYNFIPDIEALGMSDPLRDYSNQAVWYKQALEAEKSGALAQDGYRLKHKDILAKMAEKLGNKDTDQYFAKLEANEIVQAGAGGQVPGNGGQAVPPGGPVQGAPVPPVQPTGPGIPQAG